MLLAYYCSIVGADYSVTTVTTLIKVTEMHKLPKKILIPQFKVALAKSFC